MQLVIDMNLTPRWVAFLNSNGHEAFHWMSIGQPTAKDREICEYARQRGLIVVTNDLDFPQILAHTRESGPSVILLRGRRLTPETRGATLIDALKTCAAELGTGAVVSIDWSEQLRIRLLPLPGVAR